MAIRKLLDVVHGVGKQRLRREQHDGDPRKLTGQHRKWRDLSSAAGIVRQARLRTAKLRRLWAATRLGFGNRNVTIGRSSEARREYLTAYRNLLHALIAEVLHSTRCSRSVPPCRVFGYVVRAAMKHWEM
jgi:hypothetical protein